MNNGDTPPTTSDDHLLDELRSAVAANDRPPDRMVDAAKAAYVWRTIDEELAHLQFDSLASSEVLVRSEGAVHLSFATDEATIEVEVGGDDLVGRVVPPASVVRILTRSGDAVEVACDAAGQFNAERPATNPVRLVAALDAGDVVTEWFNC